jgi:hypothetical protein
VVETINGGDNSTNSKNTNPIRRAIHIHRRWNTKWLGMPNTTFVDAHKYQKIVNSQGKLITVKEFFLDIGKKMLEISFTLNLKQLFKIAPKLKRYFWHKLKPKKIQNVSKATIDKQVGYSLPKVGTIAIIIYNHMTIIQI